MQYEDNPNHTNTNEPRTSDYLCFSSSSNIQLGYNLLHLPKNRIINRKNILC